MTRHIPRWIRSRQRAALGSGLAVCGWLVGCAPEEEFPLPPVVWEGESVRVRMDDPGIQVCGGTFEALDRHAGLVRDALLLEGDGVVEYSIGDQDFVDEACQASPSQSPQACTNTGSGRVSSTEPLSQHEIVHAVRVLDPRLGLLGSAYEEGLATLYGGDVLAQAVTPLDAAEIFGVSNVSGAAQYDRAGQTMALLLERHGVEAFRQFDELAASKTDDAAFLEVFGETVEDFATFADTAVVCERSQWWQPLLECEGEPIIADAETGSLILEGRLACGEEDVHGPWLGNMWVSRHFRLDEPTSILDYSFDFPEDATLEIVGCDLGCPERFAYIGGLYDVGGVTRGLPRLEPGEYFLRLSQTVADDDGLFEIALQ